jgi:H2-forming N5,N10-methylenetetrahydromethanopterin dehydrogenase-like enzyme
MNNNKITIEEAKKQINEGFSSIYSKDDVLHLLSVLKTTGGNVVLSESQISEVSSEIANEISNAGTDIMDDYELSINCREVEIDAIRFSNGAIKDVVEEIITNFVINSK